VTSQLQWRHYPQVIISSTIKFVQNTCCTGLVACNGQACAPKCLQDLIIIIMILSARINYRRNQTKQHVHVQSTGASFIKEMNVYGPPGICDLFHFFEWFLRKRLMTKVWFPIENYCLNCTKFGQLILRKIIQIFGSRMMSNVKAKCV